MSVEERSLSVQSMLRGLAAWIAAAAALLLMASAVFASDLASLAYLGYAGSAISFLAAAAAGFFAARGGRKKRKWIGLLMAAVLCALLLLNGFLIAGKLDADGLLSMLSFTITGCFFGTLFSTGARKKKPGKGRGRRLS